ncbi:hypothetical protein J1N35_041741 [Gossypium stocksii]|uniref:Uncharacterized protein n=1 Tax=Gossypium stocksii TaxID=47602 RepID=A0A9D3UI24_9ROSI|nr:hypothetical protein J1N35_041741 [Gossypium stocksii]
MVRARFEFSSKDVQQLREKALSKLVITNEKKYHLSTFVLTLAYTATCLVKTKGEGDRVVVIDFGVDCRSRLDPPVPLTYFGNCVMNYSSSAEARNFMGGNGFHFAVEMLIIVAGLPKSNVYEADFGVMSKIKKVEMVSIERDEDVFMAESRDGSGGVEIVLALKKHEMVKFTALFSSRLPCSIRSAGIPLVDRGKAARRSCSYEQTHQAIPEGSRVSQMPTIGPFRPLNLSSG